MDVGLHNVDWAEGLNVDPVEDPLDKDHVPLVENLVLVKEQSQPVLKNRCKGGKDVPYQDLGPDLFEDEWMGTKFDPNEKPIKNPDAQWLEFEWSMNFNDQQYAVFHDHQYASNQKLLALTYSGN